MKYLVIETFRAGKEAVYEWFSAEGRMLPEGLKYIDNWLAADDRR